MELIRRAVTVAGTRLAQVLSGLTFGLREAMTLSFGLIASAAVLVAVTR